MCNQSVSQLVAGIFHDCLNSSEIGRFIAKRAQGLLTGLLAFRNAMSILLLSKSVSCAATAILPDIESVEVLDQHFTVDEGFNPDDKQCCRWVYHV
jgi:hypothetical protein